MFPVDSRSLPRVPQARGDAVDREEERPRQIRVLNGGTLRSDEQIHLDVVQGLEVGIPYRERSLEYGIRIEQRALASNGKHL